MNAEILFITGMIRFIVYCVVGIMSIICLSRKGCEQRIPHLGDLLFVFVSAFSFLSQNILNFPLGWASIYIFTPAFFVWGLTRVLYFSNHKNPNGDTNS